MAAKDAKSFTPSREQLGQRRTSRRAGRWRPWSSSPRSRSSPSTSSSTPGPT